MTTQHKLMYGLKRSPTLANFQKMPMKLPIDQHSRHEACALCRASFLPVLVSVHHGGYELVDVCACADEQEDDEEERLEIEEGGLAGLVSILRIYSLDATATHHVCDCCPSARELATWLTWMQMDGRSRYQSPGVRYASASPVRTVDKVARRFTEPHVARALPSSASTPEAAPRQVPTLAPPPQCKLWKLRLKLLALCVAQSVTVNSPSGVRPTSANFVFTIQPPPPPPHCLRRQHE